MGAKNWGHLEHHVYQILKQNSLRDKKLLLCVSGGEDSIVMMNLLLKVHPKNQIALFHFHHGIDSNVAYRNICLEYLCNFASSNRLKLYWEKSKTNLFSEEEQRRARYRSARFVLKISGFDYLVGGHHQQDLLETRLIRLIRGTGSIGLQSMREVQYEILRPLLRLSKKQISDYSDFHKLTYFQDPTNEDLKYFRNWIRNKWLVDLEQRQPGSCQAFARSLEHIQSNLHFVNEIEEGIQKTEISKYPPQDKAKNHQIKKTTSLSRRFYLTLDIGRAEQELAKLLYNNGVKNYSTSHIKEIRKRLDNRQKEFKFKIAGVLLCVNAEQIFIRK